MISRPMTTRSSTRSRVLTFPFVTPRDTLALMSALTMLAISSTGCGSSGGKTNPDGSSDGDADGGEASDAADVATSDGDGGDANAACSASGSGQLVLALRGLPAGATPMVQVTGGGLLAPTPLTAGTPVTLPGGGGYELEYRRVKVAPAAGGIVGKAFYGSATSFDGCVESGTTTTATLTYTQEPGSEHLWIAVSAAPTPGDQLGAFAGADLAATGSKNPSVWKTNNVANDSVGLPGAGAFDASGNFWVPGGAVINMYPMRALATAGDAAPTIVLTQPASSPALFAAFDSNGNLWVTRGAPANTIVRYTPADQAASGAPTPAVVISSPDLVNPAGLAFDTVGDLWVASAGNDEVLRFYSEHLGTSFTDAADVVLTAKTAATGTTPPTYTTPSGLAFDQAGTLWVGYDSTLVGFTTAQQTTTALIAGPLALNVSTGPGGFAFDESGGLWTTGDKPNTFRRFPKASLAATGDATPDIVITSTELGYARTLVLDPAPTWSPLQDSI
jgi:hypothetical protein